ncbi:MAG: hypothetical protein FWE36_00410 [Erysipelotrichales bacterium]|nr:hypothetical protein [Erysipelotrichales bacterium]
MKARRIFFISAILIFTIIYTILQVTAGWGNWNDSRAAQLIVNIMYGIFIVGIMVYAFCKTEKRTKKMRLITIISLIIIINIIAVLSIWELCILNNLSYVLSPPLFSLRNLTLRFLPLYPFVAILIYELFSNIKEDKTVE